MNALPQQGIKRDISKTKSEALSWLNDIIKEKKTSEEIVSVIVAKIEAEPVYYRHINVICDHLKKIMKFFYRQEVKIVLFGSSATKLALRDSDADIYIDFGGCLPEPPKKLVVTLKNKVRKHGYFIKAIPIFARVPIVHCVHKSQISCDLSFLNALGISNSNLIKFLLSTDDRIRPLILIIKYVLKEHGIVGKSAFTSYSLITLIIYFLQVLENPIVPSISYIQNLATEKEIVADWNTSFTTDISSLPTFSNNLSLVELLHEFFNLYSTFEFGFYIISIFTGKSYLKPVFHNPDMIPEEFYLYKKNLAKKEFNKFEYNKFMCVQDVFNHSHNVTRNITQKSLVQFQNLCWAISAMGKELLVDQNEKDENKKKYLINLFHQNEESQSKKQKKEDIIIFVGEKIDLDNCDCSEESIRSNWSKHIFNTLQDILCKVLKCEIDCQSTNSASNSSVFGNEEKLIKCEMLYHELVTKKRNEVKSELYFPEEMPEIQKEEIISNYLCDTFLKNADKIFLKFDIVCWIKKNPTCFCTNLNSKESQKNRSHLVQQVFYFIKNHFPKWIK